ncbi:MAG: hypothetical protein H6740_16900 [Alphaproteobacteria bacterium]|nr:hypothetical protein [Alphaproteobacteria bacterium]
MLLLTLTLACAGKHAPKNANEYVGDWTQGGAVTTIAQDGRRLEVVSIVDSDGETFEVRGTSYEGGVLSWDYHVPSTGYDVHIEVTSLEGDLLCASWRNAHSTGDECYDRR